MNQDSHTTSPAFIILSPRGIAARAYEIYLQRARQTGSIVMIGFALNTNCSCAGRILIAPPIISRRCLLLAQLAETLSWENTGTPLSRQAIGDSATRHGRDLLALARTRFVTCSPPQSWRSTS